MTTIMVDGVSVTTVPSPIVTSSGGSFSATFIVSGLLVGGPHSVIATDASLNSAGAIFTVIAPAIMLNPISGLGGDTVQVTGTNFAATSTITIKFDGSTQTTVPSPITSTSGGSFSATFQVPRNTAAGAHLVKAIDAGGGTASAVFTVNCATSNNCVSASSFGLGYISFNFNTFSLYTFSGSGCPPSMAVYPTGCQLTNAGLAYTIPYLLKTSYVAFSVQFRNVDPDGRTLTFDRNTIMQTAVLCETSGCGSITTPVWQIGLVDSSLKVIAWNSSGIQLLPGHAKTFWFIHQYTTPDFSKTAGVTITPVFFDVHGTICLTPTCGTTFGENLPFTTIFWPQTSSPIIVLSPVSGPSGTTVTVTGTGYAAASRITLKYDVATVTTVPAIVTTNSIGSFTATFVVPVSSPGLHTVTATDASSNTASATYTTS
jgi:hypothetical protein